MKLLAVNGSPRGRKSNSDRIIGWITQNIESLEKVYAADIKKQDESAQKVTDADSILIVFPLYTDMMPGLMKAFFEKLNAYDLSGKSATFVVHSGFPEAVHSRAVEKYLRYFTKLKNMQLLGVVVMGGSEALQVAPDGYFGKRVGALKSIGQNIADNTEIDADTLKIIARMERYSKATLAMMKFMPTDMYWNSQLKKNGVYDERCARPYGE